MRINSVSTVYGGGKYKSEDKYFSKEISSTLIKTSVYQEQYC